MRAHHWVGTAVALVLLAGCGTADPAETGAAGPQELAPPDTVVRDGDRVVGNGRLVQVPGLPARFCGVEVTADVGYEPGQEPAPRDCPSGVEVTGVDLATVPDRREKDGAVEGFAQVTGVWQAGVVAVEQQGPRQYPDRPTEQDPPCPAPAGGWPQGPADDNLSAELEAARPVLERIALGPNRMALLRPSSTQTLLGLAVPDDATKEQVERELRSAVGDRLCVVVARHTDADVEAVLEDDDLRARYGVRGSGLALGEDLQAALSVEVLVVTEELVAAMARHPAGLVEAEPALRVLRTPDRLVPESAQPASDEPEATPDLTPQDDSGAAAPGSGG